MTVTISDFSDYCQSEFLNDYIIAYTTEKLVRNLAFLSHQKVAKVKSTTSNLGPHQISCLLRHDSLAWVSAWLDLCIEKLLPFISLFFW